MLIKMKKKCVKILIIYVNKFFSTTYKYNYTRILHYV